jgi:hypothetical protein
MGAACNFLGLSLTWVYVSEERDGLGHEICNFAYINVYSGKNKIVYIHYVLN